MGMEFEWDEEKARSNLRKHGIDFEDAKQVFSDTNHIEIHDDRDYGEERLKVFGRIAPSVLVVICTERSTRERPNIMRIISARKANKDEQKFYWSYGKIHS